MIVLAIDPGPTRSAVVTYQGPDAPVIGRMHDNEVLLDLLRLQEGGVDAIIIEKVESYGMPVGVEIFDTVYWSGMFAEAADPLPVHRLGRKAVKLHLCQSMRAKDSNIRQALIDRYGGPAAIGRKATPGPLYGLAGDVWAALAVAVTWTDQSGE